MSDKKNIDHLFQEKFQHFEQQPNPELWYQIESRLQRKNKRFFSFWWISSGAAILIVGLFILYTQKNKSNEVVVDPIITTSPKKNPQQETPKDFFQKTSPTEKGEIFITGEQEKGKIQHKKRNDHTGSEKTLKSRIAHTVIKNNEQKKDNSPSVSREVDQLVKTNEVSEVIKKKIPSATITNLSTTKDSLKNQYTNQQKKELTPHQDDKSLDMNNKDKKWSVRPLIALSTMANTSNSPTDVAIRNNNTFGNTAVNIGISVSYKLSNRFILQSGVLTQKISFNTENVVLLNQFSTTNTPSSVSLRSGVNYSFSERTDLVNYASETYSIVDLDAELNQAMHYIEIPIEAKYRIANSKKIRSHLIGGFSSLFLQKNEIILLSDALGRVDIGAANNLNSVNFSGNVGLDLDYQISSNLFLNVNPMLKVHLNTFSRDSNGYQPYFIGVYSGITYQF